MVRGGNGNKSVEKWTKETWTSVGDGGGEEWIKKPSH